MPPEILVPLFTLTLLANAILVAVAIRGLIRPTVDRDRSGEHNGPARTFTPTPTPTAPPTERPMTSTERPMTADLVRAIAARRAVVETTIDPPIRERALEPAGPTDAPADEHARPPAAEPDMTLVSPPIAAPILADIPAPAPPPDARPVAVRDAVAEPVVDALDDPVTATPAVEAPRRPAAQRASGADPAARSAEPTRRGGRRRFSLPPLDDDHEKVHRSLETFLGGTEPAPAEVAAGATTVALVAVDGLPPPVRRSRPAGVAAGVPSDDDATASAIAMVERTIRGAARGSDVVTVTDRGRFRIVLLATGEVAARAYLRRIRATVEPILESADRPLRLAVATATVLDEPLVAAVRRAERRLRVAISTLDASGGRQALAEELDDDAADDPPADARPRVAAD